MKQDPDLSAQLPAAAPRPRTDHGAATPQWFSRAIEQLPSSTEIQVGDVSIAVQLWGEADNPPVVLVHGGGAHAHWWDHIAPYLAADYRVVAPDLSGHGDSGRRSSYSIGSWTDELQALLDGPLLGPAPVIIGHSMGGFMTAELAARRSADLGGIILLDSEFAPRGSQATRPDWVTSRSALGPRVYPSRADIVSKFRTLPADSQPPAFISGHIAEHSIVRVDGGWTWKFDPKFFDHDFVQLEDLRRVDCRALFIGAERGLVRPELAESIHRALGVERAPLSLVDASHHMLLDRPLALIAMLTALLSEWTITPSTGRPVRTVSTVDPKE